MNKEDLREIIEKLRDKINKYGHIYIANETAVRDQLIKPVLELLGWNPENPELVIPEQSTEEGRPDYSLLLNNNKVLFVEAKKLSIDVRKKEHITQLARYTFGVGVDFGLLTNGRNWLLLRSYEKGTNITDRIIWAIDIIEDDMEKILIRLKTISIENVERLPELTKKQDILSETWNTIIQSPEILVDPIAPVVKNQILENPDNFSIDDIKEFLNWKIPETFKPGTTSKPITQGNQSIKKRYKPSNSERIPPSKAQEISIQGNKIRISHAKDILIETANYLFDQGYFNLSQVPIDLGGWKRYIINSEPKHRDGTDFIEAKKLNCGLFIETNISSGEAYNQARKLLELAGLSKEDLQITR